MRIGVSLAIIFLNNKVDSESNIYLRTKDLRLYILISFEIIIKFNWTIF